MPFQNVVPFKNAQLVPKPESTDKLTLVTAHLRLKKCMHKTLTQRKVLALSGYHSTGWIGEKPISPSANWLQQ